MGILHRVAPIEDTNDGASRTPPSYFTKSADEPPLYDHQQGAAILPPPTGWGHRALGRMRCLMAATYRRSRWRRLLNALVRGLLRVGLGPRHTYLLTVHGRRSGTRHSTPVTLVEEGTNRWRVAPYGEVSWVRNAHAVGRVTLSRANRAKIFVTYVAG
jgi:hypothetical protein